MTAALDLRGAATPTELFPAGGHLINLVKVWGKYKKKKKKRDTDKKNAFEMDSQMVNTKHFKVIFYPSNYNCSLS